MAKDADNPFEEENAEPAGGSGSVMKLAVRVGLMMAVLGAGSAAGYALGGLFRPSAPADPNGRAEDLDVPEDPYPTSPDVSGEDFDYIEFKPIVTNLNLPRQDRYIRATVLLAVRKGKDLDAAKTKIEHNRAELRDQLTAYLSGQTLEDVRGPRNLNRIRREILEKCNRLVWPKSRPLINHVLFKDFNVQ